MIFKTDLGMITLDYLTHLIVNLKDEEREALIDSLSEKICLNCGSILKTGECWCDRDPDVFRDP